MESQPDDKLGRSREQLLTHLQSAREEERKRIARDIHDELGQDLTALKLELSLLKDELGDSGISVGRRLENMAALLDATIRSVSRIISELRPRLLDDLGLTAAMEWQVSDFQKRAAVAVALSIYPREILLDSERSTALFRILQESLSNVSRHSGATRIAVSLTEIDGIVELDVRDNGQGIQPKQLEDDRSFGLIGIRERARSLGGTAEILGSPGEGTRVVVRFPTTEEGG
jgi:signal transduction histidine kinase